MNNAIILHGSPDKAEYFDPKEPSPSNAHWLPWLQHQLLISGFLVQTPEMPIPYQPDYSSWLKVFQQFTVNENTLLIGHSNGAGLLVRWLSENDVKVGKVILIAPCLVPYDDFKKAFYDFTIDSNMSHKTNGLVCYSSDNDDPEILTSVQMLRERVIDAKYVEFTGYGHFTEDSMGTTEFPELLAEALA